MSEAIEALQFVAVAVLTLLAYHLAVAVFLCYLAAFEPRPDSEAYRGILAFAAIISIPALKHITDFIEWAEARYPDRTEQVASWLTVRDSR